jgi:hypothetical protein
MSREVERAETISPVVFAVTLLVVAAVGIWLKAVT